MGASMAPECQRIVKLPLRAAIDAGQSEQHLSWEVDCPLPNAMVSESLIG